eukprot:GEMP01000563.1.p1 GENE.GEMP01000563.1~~GEMP01000563.1.p1  ORF type:complete len:1629 (+),score=273.90 GEMP01000563.1:148-5034(+)
MEDATSISMAVGLTAGTMSNRLSTHMTRALNDLGGVLNENEDRVADLLPRGPKTDDIEDSDDDMPRFPKLYSFCAACVQTWRYIITAEFTDGETEHEFVEDVRALRDHEAHTACLFLAVNFIAEGVLSLLHTRQPLVALDLVVIVMIAIWRLSKLRIHLFSYAADREPLSEWKNVVTYIYFFLRATWISAIFHKYFFLACDPKFARYAYRTQESWKFCQTNRELLGPWPHASIVACPFDCGVLSMSSFTRLMLVKFTSIYILPLHPLGITSALLVDLLHLVAIVLLASNGATDWLRSGDDPAVLRFIVIQAGAVFIFMWSTLLRMRQNSEGYRALFVVSKALVAKSQHVYIFLCGLLPPDIVPDFLSRRENRQSFERRLVKQDSNEGVALVGLESEDNSYTLAQEHPLVGIMFISIGNLDEMMGDDFHTSALIHELHFLWSAFDCMCIKMGLQKLETVADVYVMCCGLWSEDFYEDMLAMYLFAREANQVARSRNLAGLRVGLHIGNAMSGILGRVLPRFRLMGGSMNLAARLQQSCPTGHIRASEAAMKFLPVLETEGKETLTLKGLDEITTYLISLNEGISSAAPAPKSDDALWQDSDVMKEIGQLPDHTRNILALLEGVDVPTQGYQWCPSLVQDSRKIQQPSGQKTEPAAKKQITMKLPEEVGETGSAPFRDAFLIKLIGAPESRHSRWATGTLESRQPLRPESPDTAPPNLKSGSTMTLDSREISGERPMTRTKGKLWYGVAMPTNFRPPTPAGIKTLSRQCRKLFSRAASFEADLSTPLLTDDASYRLDGYTSARSSSSPLTRQSVAGASKSSTTLEDRCVSYDDLHRLRERCRRSVLSKLARGSADSDAHHHSEFQSDDGSKLVHPSPQPSETPSTNLERFRPPPLSGLLGLSDGSNSPGSSMLGTKLLRHPNEARMRSTVQSIFSSGMMDYTRQSAPLDLNEGIDRQTTQNTMSTMCKSLKEQDSLSPPCTAGAVACVPDGNGTEGGDGMNDSTNKKMDADSLLSKAAEQRRVQFWTMESQIGAATAEYHLSDDESMTFSNKMRGGRRNTILSDSKSRSSLKMARGMSLIFPDKVEADTVWTLRGDVESWVAIEYYKWRFKKSLVTFLHMWTMCMVVIVFLSIAGFISVGHRCGWHLLRFSVCIILITVQCGPPYLTFTRKKLFKNLVERVYRNNCFEYITVTCLAISWIVVATTRIHDSVVNSDELAELSLERHNAGILLASEAFWDSCEVFIMFCCVWLRLPFLPSLILLPAGILLYGLTFLFPVDMYALVGFGKETFIGSPLIIAIFAFEDESIFRQQSLNNYQLAHISSIVEKVSEELLPEFVMNELRTGKVTTSSVIHHTFIELSVLQLDMVGFTSLAHKMKSATEVLNFLNNTFAAFDKIITEYNIYKMETVGDALLCISGFSQKCGDTPAGMAMAAFNLIKQANEYTIDVRVGLHTANNVVGGVCGSIMQRYHLYGRIMDVVNALESTCPVNSTHVSHRYRKAVEAEFRQYFPAPFTFKNWREVPPEQLFTSKGVQLDTSAVGSQQTFQTKPFYIAPRTEWTKVMGYHSTSRKPTPTSLATRGSEWTHLISSLAQPVPEPIAPASKQLLEGSFKTVAHRFDRARSARSLPSTS